MRRLPVGWTLSLAAMVVAFGTAACTPQSVAPASSNPPAATVAAEVSSSTAATSTVPSASVDATAPPVRVKHVTTAPAAQTPSRVSCSVSAKAPLPKATVTVTARVYDAKGKAVSGASAAFTWHLASGSQTSYATADSAGVARSTRNIGSAKVGRRVVVTARVTAGGESASGSASFTPKAPPVKKVATQKVYVDLSRGTFDPSTIHLKAGVPSAITFGKGGGCLSSVRSSSLGFNVDVTGGPRTVHLPPLKRGTYSFECGMSMVFGSVVVS